MIHFSNRLFKFVAHYFIRLQFSSQFRSDDLSNLEHSTERIVCLLCQYHLPVANLARLYVKVSCDYAKSVIAHIISEQATDAIRFLLQAIVQTCAE